MVPEANFFRSLNERRLSITEGVEALLEADYVKLVEVFLREVV